MNAIRDLVRMAGGPLVGALLLFSPLYGRLPVKAAMQTEAPRSGQGLVIQGDLFRMISAKPGTTINLAIGLSNLSTNEAVLDLGQADCTAGRAAPSGSHPRSLAKWLELPAPRLVIGPRMRSELRLKIKVPADAAPGSWWSAVVISTQPAAVEGAGPRIAARTSYLIQICVNIPGGKREALVGGVEVRAGKLRVPIHGAGDEVFVLKVTTKGRPDQSLRIFPGTTREIFFDVEDVPDGPAEWRLLLDDGADFVRAEKIKFVKASPPPARMVALREREFERRRTLRGNLAAVLSYGSMQSGLSLQGGATWRGISLRAGTDQLLLDGRFYQAFTTSAQVRVGPISFRAGRSWLGDRTLTSVGVSARAGRLNAQVTYTPEYETLSGSAGYRFFRRIFLNLWATAGLESGRRDFRASLMIPII